MRSRGPEPINYIRALLAKDDGVGIIEVFVTMVILSIILASMLASLSIGRLSFPISSVKTELQSKGRIIIDWIAKDVRQAPTWDIANKTPSGSYMRFQKVVGFNTGLNQYILDPDEVEYIYDANNQTLTRNVISGGVATPTWQFLNVTQAPFFTWHKDDGSIVALKDEHLLDANAIIITLTSQKQARSGHNIPYTLTTEVKMRNE